MYSMCKSCFILCCTQLTRHNFITLCCALNIRTGWKCVHINAAIIIIIIIIIIISIIITTIIIIIIIIITIIIIIITVLTT